MRWWPQGGELGREKEKRKKREAAMHAMHGSRLKFEIQARRNLAMHACMTRIRSWIDPESMRASCTMWAELQLHCVSQGSSGELRRVKKEKKKEAATMDAVADGSRLKFEIQASRNLPTHDSNSIRIDPGSWCARAAAVFSRIRNLIFYNTVQEPLPPRKCTMLWTW